MGLRLIKRKRYGEGATISKRQVDQSDFATAVQNFSSDSKLEEELIAVAEEARRKHGLKPFMADPKDFYMALEDMRKGYSAESVVIFYSKTPVRKINGSNGASIAVKPSKDLKDDQAVNRILRLPEFKLWSHKPRIKENHTENGITYGSHISYIDAARAKEYEKQFQIGDGQFQRVGSELPRQVKRLNELLRELRRPSESRNQSYIDELFHDVGQYNSNLLPTRSAYGNLMAVIQSAVGSGTPINILLVRTYDSARGRVGIGYIARPVQSGNVSKVPLNEVNA